MVNISQVLSSFLSFEQKSCVLKIIYIVPAVVEITVIPLSGIDYYVLCIKGKEKIATSS